MTPEDAMHARRAAVSRALVCAAMALMFSAFPALTWATWVLPPGQESQVEAAVRAALPDVADAQIRIEAATITVRLPRAKPDGVAGAPSAAAPTNDADGPTLLLERGDDGRLRATWRGAPDPQLPDAATLQARLDAAQVPMRWEEVAARPEGVAAGPGPGAAAQPESKQGEALADAVGHALQLERRAAHGRESARREVLQRLGTVCASGCPVWLQLRHALLLRAEGQPEAAAALLTATLQQLDGEQKLASPAQADAAGRGPPQAGGRDAGTHALRVLALALQDRDDEAMALSTQGGADGCAAAALLERDAVLRRDDLLLSRGDRLTRDHPTCSALYLPLAAAMRRTGRLDAFEALLARGAKARPDDGEVLRELAWLRARQDRVDEVFALLDRVLQAGPQETPALVDISHIATVVRAPEPWLESLRRRVEAAGPKPGAQDERAAARNADDAFLLGVLLHYRDDWRGSDAALAQAEARHGRIARLLIYRAMNHHRLGDDDTASKFIARAVALGAEDPDVLYCRAVIDLDRDPAQATRDLQAYLDRTSGTAEVNPGKQARVRHMLQDLEGCAAASSPRACLERKALLKVSLPWLGGALALVAGLLMARRWRRGRHGITAAP